MFGHILSDMDLVMLEPHNFGINNDLKTITCTRYCIKMALEKGFGLCDRYQTICLVARLKSKFRSIGRHFFDFNLPPYISVIEEVNDKSYVCTTIYFKRRFLFFIKVDFDHSEVVSSFLFDRKLIFKRPK